MHEQGIACQEGVLPKSTTALSAHGLHAGRDSSRCLHASVEIVINQASVLFAPFWNDLQIYDDGRDLYDAMLAAIDTAQESIYLEISIWKDDAPGQEFKEHLACKAAQGYGKMTKKLVFQA